MDEKRGLHERAHIVALCTGWVYENKCLLPSLSRHLEEYDGQFDAEAFVSIAVAWLIDNNSDQQEFVASAFEWLDFEFQKGNAVVRSFVLDYVLAAISVESENLIDVRRMLGPNLSAHLMPNRNG